ncbi:hypothetical protein Q7A53_06320 [Halobacillus rhizosphaerae]|uniref:hypothetical protein n=1 Tax=Halobacillus rhizosphaerae TaxID=3064889 RepID=UPI00398B95F5
MLKQKVIDAYADGSELSTILVSFNITHKQLTEILLTYKEESKYKRTFTDEFKTVIAERDSNGIPRSHIANELQLNVGTVKKACEKFGLAVKEKAVSDNEFTLMCGNFTLDKCPTCNSRKNNMVDENETYCMDCGSSHIYGDDGKHVQKINWDHVD